MTARSTTRDADRWLWRSLGYWIVASAVFGPVGTVIAINAFSPGGTLTWPGGLLAVLAGVAVASLLAAVGLVRLTAEHASVVQTLLAVGTSTRVASETLSVPLPVAAQLIVHAVASQRQGQASAWLLLTSFLHDLKAPVAGLRHMLDPSSASEGSIKDDEVLRDVRRELTSVQVLVHNALDFARFQQDDVAVSVGAVNVRRVVDEVVKRVGWAAHASAVSVSVDGDWIADGDARLVARVCENLLLNGVLHARTHVHVAISPGLVVIEDDGPGLPRSVLDALDEYNSSRKLTYGRLTDATGHGIGFLAANAMLRSIGGKLVVQSSKRTGTALLAYLRPPS